MIGNCQNCKVYCALERCHLQGKLYLLCHTCSERTKTRYVKGDVGTKPRVITLADVVAYRDRLARTGRLPAVLKKARALGSFG
jgi:hypothetical protein